MQRIRPWLCGLSIVVVVATGCGDANDANADSAARDSLQSSGGEVVPDSMAAASGGGRWLSDANVVSLFELVNAHQIAVAQTELSAWHSDTVRAFAAATVTENNQLQTSVDSAARVIRAVPVAPALDSTIAPQQKAELDSLKQYKGAQMDQAFMTAAIRDHAAYVTFLGQLAAASERPELRDVLLQALGREQLHLARARAVRAVLAFAASDSASKAKGSGGANQR